MIDYFNIGWLVLWFILTHALSLHFVLCLCHGRTNKDSFNVLFIVNSYSLLKHFSKPKAGDLISYTFFWTASMLIPNAFKVYFMSCKKAVDYLHYKDQVFQTLCWIFGEAQPVELYNLTGSNNKSPFTVLYMSIGHYKWLYITETERYITAIKGNMLEKQIRTLFLGGLCLLIEN